MTFFWVFAYDIGMPNLLARLGASALSLVPAGKALAQEKPGNDDDNKKGKATQQAGAAELGWRGTVFQADRTPHVRPVAQPKNVSGQISADPKARDAWHAQKAVNIALNKLDFVRAGQAQLKNWDPSKLAKDDYPNVDNFKAEAIAKVIEDTIPGAKVNNVVQFNQDIKVLPAATMLVELDEPIEFGEKNFVRTLRITVNQETGELNLMAPYRNSDFDYNENGSLNNVELRTFHIGDDQPFSELRIEASNDVSELTVVNKNGGRAVHVVIPSNAVTVHHNNADDAGAKRDEAFLSSELGKVLNDPEFLKDTKFDEDGLPIFTQREVDAFAKALKAAVSTNPEMQGIEFTDAVTYKDISVETHNNPNQRFLFLNFTGGKEFMGLDGKPVKYNTFRVYAKDSDKEGGKTTVQVRRSYNSEATDQGHTFTTVHQNENSMNRTVYVMRHNPELGEGQINQSFKPQPEPTEGYIRTVERDASADFTHFAKVNAD